MGDENGVVRLYDLDKRIPLLQDEFELPDTVLYKKEVLEDDVDETLLAYQQLKSGDPGAGSGEEYHMECYGDGRGRGRYRITAVALHRSGSQIVVGYALREHWQAGDPKFAHVVCVFNILQNRLHLATLIELQFDAI